MLPSQLKRRLELFLENEARSCSMDFGCVTPEYVFRSWGGSVARDRGDRSASRGGVRRQVELLKAA